MLICFARGQCGAFVALSPTGSRPLPALVHSTRRFPLLVVSQQGSELRKRRTDPEQMKLGSLNRFFSTNFSQLSEDTK